MGNTWQPGVDGADSAGAYSGPVSFSAGAATCPNYTLADIDTAWDPDCADGFPSVSGVQNVAIDDGACAGGSANPVGPLIVSE